MGFAVPKAKPTGKAASDSRYFDMYNMQSETDTLVFRAQHRDNDVYCSHHWTHPNSGIWIAALPVGFVLDTAELIPCLEQPQQQPQNKSRETI